MLSLAQIWVQIARARLPLSIERHVLADVIDHALAGVIHAVVCRPALTRKEVREVIVEMTRASA